MQISQKDMARLVQDYTDGWCGADKTKILSTVAEGCEVIESHGPRYRGRKEIEGWIDAWHGAGGKVLRWEIRSLHTFEHAACYEWEFSCNWDGEADSFTGCSVVEFADGKIAAIREYRTIKS